MIFFRATFKLFSYTFAFPCTKSCM